MWKKRGSNSRDVIHRNHTLLTCCVILLHMWFPANKTSSNAQLHLAYIPFITFSGLLPLHLCKAISPTFSSLTINNWAISHFHNSISLSTSQRYLPFTFTRLSISPPSSQGYLSFLLTLPSLTRHNLLPLKDYEIIFQFPTLASPFLLYTQSTVYIPSSCRPALTSSIYD